MSLFSSSDQNKNYYYYDGNSRRMNVELPLLILGDDNDNNDSDNAVIPLPSSHLPPELSTLNTYSLRLKSASQRRLIDTVSKSPDRSYGHLVTSEVKVGAVGCAVELLIAARPVAEQQEQQTSTDLPDSSDVSVLTRGLWRFVVKEIISTFPYPVVLVDEIVDSVEPTNDDGQKESETTVDTTSSSPSPEEEQPTIYNDFEEDLIVNTMDDQPQHDNNNNDSTEDEEDEDLFIDTSIPDSDLTSLTLQTMKTYVNLLRSTDTTTTTPLQDYLASQQQQQQGDSVRPDTEEIVAVTQVFLQELIEMSSPSDRRYALAFLAAEIVNVNNEIRRRIVTTTDNHYRLRIVLSALRRKLDERRAIQVTDTITGTTTSNTDLQVGTPSLPTWSNDLKAGLKVEYFWNEEWGWCPGEIQQVERIFDEVIVTLKFEADGEVHRLPVTAEEKVRWRPVQRK